MRSLALGACLLTVALLIAAPLRAAETDPNLRRLLTEAIGDSSSFSDRFEAEVWLMDMGHRLQRYLAKREERILLLRSVHAEAKRARLEPELVLALIEVESRFDRFAVSKAGAQGLMQVMPFWLAEIGRPNDNLFHIDTNLRLGCTILKYYMEMENDDLNRALGRYNGSLGKRKYPNKVLDKLRLKWFRV